MNMTSLSQVPCSWWWPESVSVYLASVGGIRWLCQASIVIVRYSKHLLIQPEQQQSRAEPVLPASEPDNRDGIPRIDVDLQETEDDRAVVVLDYQRKGKRPVIKTTTRQTYFLLVIGLVVPEKLKLGDESEQGLTLPAEYYARVKAKEVDERPTEHYSGFDGLDKQIQELIEAVVLPMTHKDMFKNLGIHPPKGVLHVAARFRLSTFLKLAGLQLVQMFIGDRAKLVRDAFALAKEKSPAITSCTRLHCRRI
ncbi:26S protease regulatory subunit 6a [Culex quinquefasciatus]|uniref:26S protease regulatory subunit 6a n=1 Tax=Culex quinquefasciatus TaxID=7176 RepID=B0WT93_CULQU|nr:26S protease regulatory subunit 6a [Culex quinquefasciatus]|eukprot:XP_001870850.1 26S protease regulatory subunit 6a [Culex quinquefasciatus]